LHYSNLTSSSSSSSSTTTSTTTSLSHKNNIQKSTVWEFFRVTPNKLVCKKCNSQLSKTSSVTTLRRHLKQIHSVVAPKIQRTLHQYCNDPHNSIDQRKRDDAVINWIICDLQSINVVEKEEWRTMISAFDPRYRFHGRTTIHDHGFKIKSNKYKYKYYNK